MVCQLKPCPIYFLHASNANPNGNRQAKIEEIRVNAIPCKEKWPKYFSINGSK
jgi:hypothetical protein